MGHVHGPAAVFVIGFYVKLLTTMLTGLLLGRHDFFSHAGQHLQAIRRAQCWLIGIGLAIGAAFGVWKAVVDNVAHA